MIGRCQGPAWELDDFSTCFQQDYLQTIIPLIFCGTALLYIAYKGARAALRSNDARGYSLINNSKHDWDVGHDSTAHVNGHANGNGNGHVHGVPDHAIDNDDDCDELDRNQEVALHATTSHADRTKVLQASRPRGQGLLVGVEAMVSLGQLIISVIAYRREAWGPHSHAASVAEIATWTFILVVVLARLGLTYTSSAAFSPLWYSTAFLYLAIWVVYALLFRSYIIHPLSGISRALMSTRFAFITVLSAIALTSRQGNQVVELEYEGDIPPARQTAVSLLSHVSFAWVDPIIWHGYRNVFEMDAVWNLRPTDKAANVLGRYREMKKTTKLIWHLLRFFRVSLLQQASWACLSGFNTFVPTLLLKAILEYVERPDRTPVTSAWFFVMLLFVSGVVSAVADGMALWLGRTVCIQLRAVIVGELYAKALRRRVGARAEKVLGAKKEAFTRFSGPFKKIFMLGQSGKKQPDQKKQDDAEHEQEQDSKTSSEQVSSGTVINLMAVDSFKVGEIGAYLHFLWASTPVQVIVAVVLLYRILGYSSIAGIGMMVLLLPVNLFISQQFAKYQTKILAATDARIHVTNEVLSNIRIIKYFAWEHRWMDAVNEKRSTELKHLWRRYILWSCAGTVWGGAPMLIALLSFAVYTLVEKKPLVPSVAFTALSLFQILRIPLDQLADMVAHVQEAKVSIDRIEEFLNEEDTEKYQQLRNSQPGGEPTIGFDKATYSWGSKENSEAEEAFAIMDLDMRFHVGKLNVIAGPTGSGKTSLLLALLGEMTLLSGQGHLPGGPSREDARRDPVTGLTETVAYCAQQAWLMNGTIRQNIVFAAPWDPRRYNDVLYVCSLIKDLEILDNRDETLVGEKGVTLSGGQKQRISLARAIYSDSRHLLLDDILSAVDSHTAKWIFEKALKGHLMDGRTCILVTHNISLTLGEASFAVLLDNGRIAAQGSAEQVINSGKIGDDFVRSSPTSTMPSRAASIAGSESPKKGSTPEGNSPVLESAPLPNGDADGKADPVDHMDNPLGGPTTAIFSPAANGMQEGKAEGRVKLKNITMYLRSMGGPYFWCLALVLFIAQQLSNVSTNLWIREWANAYSAREVAGADRSPVTYVRGISGTTPCHGSGSCTLNLPFFNDQRSWKMLTLSEQVNDPYYLGMYALLSGIFFFINFARSFLPFWGSLAASKKIHERLLESVARAKFRFFDSTPLGQIMNRFSKDVENIDQEIAPTAVGIMHCLMTIITVIITICVITPGFLIAGAFITVIYLAIGSFYINGSRDLKRLESVQRSPLYQLFGETLTGMVTIRAYGDERRFIRDNLSKINTHSRPFIYLWAMNRWLAVRVDLTGALVSFFSGVFVVLSVGKIDPGAAGLALTYAVTFTENILWFVRLYAFNEQNMNSIERVDEYLQVEQEAPALIPEKAPTADWPSQGAVEFVNYTTRYRTDFDPVLKNINLKIKPCEKIGIVGRTGAGKSSLALALFRALEAEKGKIVVDGVEIGEIGLQNLREAIVMVPQDPTLFSGTIRSNLDPFGLFTDEEVFTALRRVQLIGSTTTGTATPSRPQTPTGNNKNGKGAPPTALRTALHNATANAASATGPADNKNIFLNLQSSIAESGTNLSQGQRQLLCLARALLKSPKVLLMDEATASIDYATDAKIQETIRELKGNTIITIAHRLKTIIDYDRVIVLEQGEVVEFGEPWELVKPRDEEVGEKRWLRQMCEMSGELDVLEREAKKSWDSKRLVDDL